MLVCEECGEVNKVYMSWCGDCGELLVGIEVIIIKKLKLFRVLKKNKVLSGKFLFNKFLSVVSDSFSI